MSSVSSHLSAINNHRFPPPLISYYLDSKPILKSLLNSLSDSRNALPLPPNESPTLGPEDSFQRVNLILSLHCLKTINRNSTTSEKDACHLVCNIRCYIIWPLLTFRPHLLLSNSTPSSFSHCELQPCMYYMQLHPCIHLASLTFVTYYCVNNTIILLLVLFLSLPNTHTFPCLANCCSFFGTQ